MTEGDHKAVICEEFTRQADAYARATAVTDCSDELVTDVDWWLESAQTGPGDAAEARRRLDEDLQHDLSGACPCLSAGRMVFHHRTLAVIGRKLR